MLGVQADTFEHTERGNMDTLTTIDATVPAQVVYTVLDALHNDAGGSERACLCHMVQVPHTYIPLVFNQIMRSVEVWASLGAVVVND